MFFINWCKCSNVKIINAKGSVIVHIVIWHTSSWSINDKHHGLSVLKTFISTITKSTLKSCSINKLYKCPSWVIGVQFDNNTSQSIQNFTFYTVTGTQFLWWNITGMWLCFDMTADKDMKSMRTGRESFEWWLFVSQSFLSTSEEFLKEVYASIFIKQCLINSCKSNN